VSKLLKNSQQTHNVPARYDPLCPQCWDADSVNQTQLHFTLQSASHWRRVYDDFNYEEFYNFIVDYFEADMSPNARKEAKGLLGWWNE